MRPKQKLTVHRILFILLIPLFSAGSFAFHTEAGVPNLKPGQRAQDQVTATPTASEPKEVSNGTASEEAPAEMPASTPTVTLTAPASPVPETGTPEPSVPAGEFSAQLLANGQFVWGPNVGDFDVGTFLTQQRSPLSAYAEYIEGTARYWSVNPRVLLAALEVQDGWVTNGPGALPPEAVQEKIEVFSATLHQAFYEHLYNWGERKARRAPGAAAQPSIQLSDGTSIQVGSEVSSGTFAVTYALSADFSEAETLEALSVDLQGGFTQTFARFFPRVDPLDDSNDITPDSPPPDDLFQFPFPLGTAWRFSGAHSWGGGGGYSDRSSMDFLTTWSNFPAPPFKNSVAAAGGNAWVVPPSQAPLPCWVEVDHGGGWMTSYYHLINLGDSAGTTGTINQNQLVGSIGTETCNGGFATGAHVHFTLWYNGALADLDGIKLSGWTIHEGPRDENPYQTGYIERDGVIKTPYSTVLNDYLEYYGNGLDYSLQFHGNGSGDIDRLKIPMVDFDPADFTGPPTDVGYYDFTIEWWLKAQPGANPAGPIACGANQNWKQGDLLLDRSRGSGERQWGVSLADGKIAFGVSNTSGQHYTLCSQTSVDDGEWHHILIQRNRYDNSQGLYSDGQLWIFIDGVLESTAVGPIGDISYPDSAAPPNSCGTSGSEPCTDDPFLVIGASKYDVSGAFDGWIDDLRFSWWVRYLEPVIPIEDTVALFSFNEGSGTVIYDTGAFDSGASTGTLYYGGSPAGPTFSTTVPNLQYEHIFLPLISR